MTEESSRGREDPSPDGFERQLEEIESIVARLEAGDVELEEALALFERGVARLRQAGRLLDRAEGRVEELIDSATGDLTFESLDGGQRRDAEDGEA
jgi:exodeoxyribonuclease VII small subunit